MKLTERAAAIRCARVYLREARLRAGTHAQRGFAFTLLGWAGNARRRAMQMVRSQIQGELFQERK